MWKLSKVLVVAAVMAAAQLGAPALAASAEGGILGAGEPGTVSDSYIVVLRNGAGDRGAEFAKRVNGKVGHKYKHALRGFEMTMSEKAAKRLGGAGDRGHRLGHRRPRPR